MSKLNVLGLLEGGLLGLGTTMADAAAQQGEIKRAAATTRFSPWTNLKAGPVRQVTPFKNIAGSALMGAGQKEGTSFLENAWNALPLGGGEEGMVDAKVADTPSYRSVASTVPDISSAQVANFKSENYPSLGVSSLGNRAPQSIDGGYGKLPSRRVTSWLSLNTDLPGTGTDFDLPGTRRRF